MIGWVDECDGLFGDAIGTSSDGVEIHDKQGRRVYLRWPDAIAHARVIMIAAQERGLASGDTDAR